MIYELTAYMKLLHYLRGFCKSPTHNLAVYFRAVYNTPIFPALDMLLGAVYIIVISVSLLPSYRIANLIFPFIKILALCKNS